ncbi:MULTISPECIES: fimbrial biogenesis usher protein [unclassified Brenneria]|uniref:fimbrial biogenesis usher protein n=1 Tax=unclassified Brenneria TaxID=2634434 RepID=UPI0018F0F1E8|nr:fimbrial biogenesis usher protein [Brenneria sp. L3-3C-1]MBJ7223484.1 fimbrial biogenesis usher protein [Brenneria sp. L3-3C-1]MEE3644724.1 fimbrial biogenesis usher protein [Brenneria sp. L3_3C_1]
MRPFYWKRSPRHQRVTARWRRAPLCRAIALCVALPAASAYAELFFNPAFLSNDPAAVADLSRFEQGKGQPPGVYHVDIYLDGEYVATRDIKFNARQPVSADAAQEDDSGLDPCITRSQLETFNVNTKAFPTIANAPADQCVALTRLIPDAHTAFDFELQRLNVTLPQASLNNSARGYIPPEQWDDGINAALLNYDFTGSNTSGDDSSNNYFLNLNSGLNWGGWRLRDYSTWNYYSYQGRRTHDWQHVNTYLQRTIVPLKSELTLGDSSTSSEVFDSLGFRGVRLASDDNMLPDSLRGFAPTIRGVARSNARVTVRQNGYVIYQTYVPPGAFTIDDLYPTTSSGDLVVTVTESDNSTNSFTIPYSAVPVLQREGRVKYALTAGQYRSNYSQQDKPEFAQGTLIWGLPAGVTLYGGSQLADDYQSMALGAGKNLGEWGAFSADVTQAYSTLADGSDHQGQSLRFLYARSLNALGTNFQLLGYRYSTQGFYTLDETSYKQMSGYSIDTVSVRPVYQDYYDLNHTKKGKVQVNITQHIGDNGTLFFTGSRQDYWHTDKTADLWQAGYSGSWDGISYSLTYSYNKNLGVEADRLVAFNLSLPLGQWLSGGGRKTDITHSSNSSYLTYNANTDTHGRNIQQAGVSGTLLDDNNLGYGVQQGYGSQGIGYSGNASLNYQGEYGNSNVGYNYSKGFRQVHYGVSGGVVAHANGVTLSQPLSDTNVLVSAPGASGVKLEDVTGVSTDWRGYAVVPYATTYRRNRIALDVNTLNNRTEVDDAVVNVVPTRGALVRANFDARVGVRALITLRQRGGKPVPFGAEVRRADSNGTAIVGDNGQVFLSGLSPKGVLLVAWGASAQQQCAINYTLPAGSENKPMTYAKAECL